MADARRTLTVLVLVVVAAAAAMILFGGGEPLRMAPPAGVVPAATNGGTTAAAPRTATTAEAGDDVLRTAASSGTGGVGGIVLDGFGKPAPRVSVSLQRTAERRSRRRDGLGLESSFELPSTWTLVTDDQGSFGMGGLELGEYELAVIGVDRSVRAQVTVDAIASVQLQLPRGKVLTIGCVVRRGQRIWSRISSVDQERMADSDGFVAMLLPPGRHRLEVMRIGSEPGPDLVLAEHELSVPGDVGTLRYELPARGADVEAVAATAHGPHRQQVALILTELPGTGAVARSLRAAGAEGSVSVKSVPPGRWQAVMLGTQMQRTPPQTFEIGLDTETVQLSFVAGDGATVFLQLRTEDGRTPRLPFAALPQLACAGLRLLAEDLSGVIDPVPGAKVGYLGVPAGPAELMAVDPEVDGAVTFAGVEVPSGIVLEVRPGAREILTVDVRRRANVELVAASATGREDETARLSLFVGSKRVLPPVPERSSRWQGWLPPGDYRVVIERGNVRREHDFVVLRADVRLRLRP